MNDIYRIEKSFVENMKEILEIHKMNANTFFQICLTKLWLKRHDNIKMLEDTDRIAYTVKYDKVDSLSRPMLIMKFETLRIYFPNKSDNDLLNTALHYEILSWGKQ